MGDLYKNSHHKVLKYNHHTFASIYLQHASLLFFHNLYDLPLRGAFLNHLLFTIHHLPLLFTIDNLLFTATSVIPEMACYDSSCLFETHFSGRDFVANGVGPGA